MEETKVDQGNIAVGCGIVIGLQVVFAIVGFLVMGMRNWGKAEVLLASSWAWTQWLGIVPVALFYRRNGQPRTLQGMLIMGFIGLLLGSACAGTFYNFHLQ